MRTLKLQRRLPQRFALTGLKGRTSLEQAYSDPMKRSVSPMHRRRRFSATPSPALEPAALGPGGETGEAAEIDPNDLIGNLVGGRIAGKLGKRGMKGLTTTSLMGLLANAPLSAFPPAIAQSVAAGLFTPVQLMNTLIGATITGQAAKGGQAALQGHGLPADLQNQAVTGIVKGLPMTATGHAIDWGKGKTGPSQFADEVVDLTLANAPLGYTSNQALSEQAAAQEAAFADEVAGLEEANAPFAGGMDIGIQGGNVGPGAGPGPATGPGSPGEGGDGGTVLCTVLYQKGVMPAHMYAQDVEYGRRLPQDVIDGYHIWAIPVAGWMTKNELLTRVMTPFIMSWGKHMAGESTLFGTVCEKAGIPMCRLIFKIQDLLKNLSATMRRGPHYRDLV